MGFRLSPIFRLLLFTSSEVPIPLLFSQKQETCSTSDQLLTEGSLLYMILVQWDIQRAGLGGLARKSGQLGPIAKERSS